MPKHATGNLVASVEICGEGPHGDRPPFSLFGRTISEHLLCAFWRENKAWQTCEEIGIEFSFDVYHDPGCNYRPNGDPGYPPEHEDERIVLQLFWMKHAKPAGYFSHLLTDMVLAAFGNEIQALIESAELPERGDDDE